MTSIPAALEPTLIRQGLRLRAVRRHQELLLKALHDGAKPQFRIVDTCRQDNGGLLGPATELLRRLANGTGADSAELPARGFIAFVPAAGAASRYSQPLADVIQALEGDDRDALRTSLAALRAAGAAAWPLPEDVKALLALDEPPALDAAGRERLLRGLQLPKALMPCVAEGTSFLALKHAEHRRLRGLDGEIYVTPPGMREAFRDELLRAATDAATNGPSESDAAAVPSVLPARFLEQGPALSTIRFRRDGSPWRDEAGEVSLVPAGHGALACLFPEAGRLFDESHSLFIRNVDNIMGTGPDAVAATDAFLRLHARILDKVRRIRHHLAADRLEHAAEVAGQLLVLAGAETAAADARALAGVADPSERVLWEVQLRLFHAQPAGRMDRELLEAHYRRPVNTLGQVPNTGGDVGGTPCFVSAPGGADGPRTVKVCSEVPHVSEADKHAFLANPAKATHFNPVFAAAELIGDPDYYEGRNHDFWLLAEKTYRGHPVVYFETVLYELLGNGDLANALFVEVPRLVFNPHKALKDAVNRSVRDWLPA